MKYIQLEDILHPKQLYITESYEKLGMDIKAVKHSMATSTCFEKAQLLLWPPERIVKAVFFYKDSDVYGFVFPEIGKKEAPSYIDTKETISKLLGTSKKKAKCFKNSYCPKGMEYGTCTPFVFEDSFEERNNSKILKKIFIKNLPCLEGSLVDISVGGFGEYAHKVSLHLKYNDIYNILYHKFGDKIQRTDF